MVIKEFYLTSLMGKKLYYFYSNKGYQLLQVETNKIVNCAIEEENSLHTYKETNKKIPISKELIIPNDKL